MSTYTDFLLTGIKRQVNLDRALPEAENHVLIINDGEIFQWPCPKCKRALGVVERDRVLGGYGARHQHRIRICCKKCGYKTVWTRGWEKVTERWVSGGVL